MSWCAFYRNIYSQDKDKQPPKKYIENDFSLDRWLEQQEHRQWHESNTQSTAREGAEVFSVV